jgi:hypothetical protein
MNDDGDTKDDVKMPDGEVGEKITKLFTTEEKDTSMISPNAPNVLDHGKLTLLQTSSFLPPWVSRPPLRPRRLPSRVKDSVPQPHTRTLPVL